MITSFLTSLRQSKRTILLNQKIRSEIYRWSVELEIKRSFNPPITDPSAAVEAFKWYVEFHK